MLMKAVKAGLPLVKVTTRDLINLESILVEILGCNVRFVTPAKGGVPSVVKGSVLYCIRPSRVDFTGLYKDMIGAGATLIVVNPDDDAPEFFDAGELEVPPGIVHAFLEKVAMPEYVEPLASLLSGLTLKEVGELCRLAMVGGGALTPNSVIESRMQLFGTQRGVVQIDTREGFYLPQAWMKEWLEIEGRILLHKEAPAVLRPRGLLFDGAAGTGKTSGAKYLARALGLPLYRIDLASLLGRYVGQSEQNLASALSYLDKVSPAVCLMDEVEKLFQSGTDDAGVTSRLLSGLLWWLQEHAGRTLTIMTTNNVEALPKELYRPGRIDQVVTFEGLQLNEAISFMSKVVAQFDVKVSRKQMMDEVQNLFTEDTKVSQAALTQAAYRLVKMAYLKQEARASE